MRSAIGSFGKDCRGNIALVFALSLPVLAGAVAAAVDLNTWWSARQRLQIAADGAVLAAAREFQLATASNQSVARAAEDFLRAALSDKGPAPTSVTASAAMQDRSIRLDITAEVSPILSRVIVDKVQFVNASATARLSSGPPVCVIGLDPKQPGTVSFKSGSLLTANKCAVYSNSSDRSSLKGEDGAQATSALFCSAGGVSIKKATLSPAPMTDCPVIKDPLASRPEPDVGGCVATKLVVSKTTTTLSPGTYCGGLRVTEGANVTLLSGVYVFKDGPLVVDKKSTFQGTYVGLFFTGDKASLLFDKDSTISMTAPKDGPMSGILLSESRSLATPEPAPLPTDGDTGLVTGLVSAILAPPPLPAGAPPMREYRILSDNARQLIGTIYLPNGRLMIDSKKAVADQSAYTVIVVRRLELFDGPNLYLNSNYAASDVPVPKGVGPVTGGGVSLTR